MVNAWSSSYHGRRSSNGPQLAWRGGSIHRYGFFRSRQENNPWLRIELSRPAVLTSVIIINRKDCCGERLKNLEISGGMKNDLTNPVIGEFKGPGTTEGKHFIPLKGPTEVSYMTFQLKMRMGILQLNGIRFTEKRGTCLVSEIVQYI